MRTLPLTAFYETAQPMPSATPGQLIRSESFDDYDLPLSVSAVRILYHSRAATGEDVASSGVVLFPAEKKAPPGGWPVIAWAHGSSGVARTCAPSLRRNLVQGPLLSMYVDLGYAIIATDYTGLGTKFRNAYLDAPSNAMDVISSIPAARKAVPQLGSRWIVLGTAEGALTALAVSEKENELQGADYRGAVAVSDFGSAKDIFADAGQRSSTIKLASLFYGTKTVYPEFQPSAVLIGEGLRAYKQIEETCPDLGTISEPPVAGSVRPDWEDNKFVMRYLNRSSSGRAEAAGPILFISSDGQSASSSVSPAISRMCKAGDRVQWLRYPDADPGRVTGDSVRDQIAWIEARFAGRAPAATCGAMP